MTAARGSVRMLRVRPSRLSLALFRAAVDRQRYQWQRSGGRSGRLLLGPDEHGNWWPLGDYENERAAALAAAGLRRWVLQINHASEGLHVVEHVLLRPRRADGPHQRLQHDSAFYTLRISVVFPGWTVRTIQEGFRAFAEETVRMNCPAHVAAQCLWFDVPAMRSFEKDFDRWLGALRSYRGGAAEDNAARRLDHASCAVIAHLHPAAPSAHGRKS